MYEDIKGLEPQKVLRHFWDLSQVPRQPGFKQPVSDFVAEYARGLGLPVVQDDHWNVIVRKPASKGYENASPVLLHAHMDMVCEKEPGVEHDFTKDPLELYVEDGDVIRARGTTLGADDGIGVAVIMAILEDQVHDHPPIEAVFTTDEETDMNGAFALDFSQFKSKIVLNLDSQPIQVCGSGEMEVLMDIPIEWIPVKRGSRLFRLGIGGLMGGHSGIQAMQELGNAITLLNRVLCALREKTCIQIISVKGGQEFSTAFARDASAIIAINDNDMQKAMEIINACSDIFKNELKNRDPGVNVSFEPADSCCEEALSDRTSDILNTLLCCLPDGVFTMNKTFKGCMESCSNIGTLRTEEERIVVGSTIRSAVVSRKNYLLDKMKRLCEVLGVSCAVNRDLPQWDYSVSDELLSLVQGIYKGCKLDFAQGTLEAGIFCTNMPGISYVALAPPYYNCHSPAEYFLASECRENYECLLELLSKLKQ